MPKRFYEIDPYFNYLLGIREVFKRVNGRECCFKSTQKWQEVCKKPPSSWLLSLKDNRKVPEKSHF